jgi:hypothetical protein
VCNVTDARQPAPFDEESYYQDPMGFFARLRESRPVAPVPMPGYGRAWIVTRYADVRTVLTDPRLAKDVRRWPGGSRSRPSDARGVGAHMLHADPPDHARLRRLVQKVFTPRRAGLRPRAEEIAAGLLDEMTAARGDVIDLLDAYARPLPIAVLCELLGIPVADRAWMAVTVAAYDLRAEHQRVEQQLAAYFTQLIAARRAEPGDDLVSALVVARDSAGARCSRRPSGFSPRPVPPTGIPRSSPTRTASTSTATPAATSPSATAFTTAWALPWPAWRPRSPSAPCSPASRRYRSRDPAGTPLASGQRHERPGVPPCPPGRHGHLPGVGRSSILLAQILLTQIIWSHTFEP